MSRAKKQPGKLPFRRGDVVQVRPADEIFCTLDVAGKLEGLPFMPEMVQYCGRRFRVYRRADKVFLDRHYVARMKATVLLEGLRCDGHAHGGCQMACLLLWKEAWLRPAEVSQERGDARIGRRCAGTGGLRTAENGRFSCQATGLIGATSRLSGLDPRQYLRDLVSRDVSLRQLAAEVGLMAYNKGRHLLGYRPHGTLSGNGEAGAPENLDLQPGELVRVKSRKEVAATLDACSRTRGLTFTPEMATHCGKTYRVAARVDRIILEWSGEMRSIPNTVILEEVTCRGIGARLCPRNCYLLWREAWLKKADDGVSTRAADR